jgi:hypothetical protein
MTDSIKDNNIDGGILGSPQFQGFEPPPKKWTVNVLKRKNISYEQNE